MNQYNRSRRGVAVYAGRKGHVAEVRCYTPMASCWGCTRKGQNCHNEKN